MKRSQEADSTRAGWTRGRWAWALILAFGWAASGSEAAAQEKLVYVKKASREETRQASLAASGQSKLDGAWHLVGPFDNKGFSVPLPPEAAVDLAAKYQGKGGEEIAWRKTDFVDGKVHNLAPKFKQTNNCVCYLYREIDSPAGGQVRASLGSDDGIIVFVNGKKVFENDANRPAAPDQDFAVLPLKPGKNQLLLKITNNGGNWEFYFQAAASARLIAELEQKLDDDFPPAGEVAHYRMLTLPLPENELIEVGGLAFRPDGKLYVATRRGDVWLVSNPTSKDLSEVTFKPYARGLHEILGLRVVPEGLLLCQRPEITLLKDADGDDEADEFITINDRFGVSGDYHEYLYGPARDKDGNLFVTLNVGFGGGHQAKVPYRGYCLKVTPEGKMIPWAYGLRSPNGLNFSPDGRLYYTDNQGEWVGSCKMHEIRQGEFYGHMASVRWQPGKKDGDRPEMVPPVIWFPYSLSKSTTEPVWDTTQGKFGPFAGQTFIGDLTNSLIMRAMLEEVDGRMQGAVTSFRSGFICGVNRLAWAPDGSLIVGQTNRGWGSVGGQPHGLQRLVYTGRTPFEIQNMKVTPQGWDLTFTEPVEKTRAAKPEAYILSSYTYHHWATYGSPEIDRKEHQIEKVEVSEDGKTVRLFVPERTLKKVYQLTLKDFSNQAGQTLLHPDIYYTLNHLPAAR